MYVIIVARYTEQKIPFGTRPMKLRYNFLPIAMLQTLQANM